MNVANEIIDILVLDFNKKEESLQCLKSIKKYCNFNHRVIFYSNGGQQDYVWEFYKDGLIDQCIFSRENEGLGLGTRDLFNTARSEIVLYFQNDQYIGRDINQNEVNSISYIIKDSHPAESNIKSISIAGNPCGDMVYSERGHFINRQFYLTMEKIIPLGRGGAGPYHDEPWREGDIQKFYKDNGFIHYTDYRLAIIDNGKSAYRQNPDKSVWRHLPDTKELWLISGPVKEKFVYPKFNDKEWDEVLTNQKWNGKIPEDEKKDSFKVDHWH